MANLTKLPRAGTWEVDLFPAPGLHVADADLAGMLLVVDRDSGAIRQVEAIEVGADILPAVLRAATSPPSQLAPCRPERILCRVQHVASLSRAASRLGARLEVQAELPAIQEVAESLLEHFSGPEPYLPEEPGPWRQAVAELVRLAPWEVVPDEVRLRFPSGHPALSDAVAVIIGMIGEQRGLSIHPTERDYKAFVTMAERGSMDSREPWLAWGVHLVPLEDLDPVEQQRGAELGLVFGDLGLVLFAVSEKGMRPLRADEEGACLQALRGVCAAFAQHGEAMVHVPTSTRVRTDGGSLVVETTPPPLGDELGPTLIGHDYQLMIGADPAGPEIVFKQAKADARYLVRLLRQVDGLSFEPRSELTEIVAWSGDDRLGVLSRGPFPPEVLAPWRAQGSGMVRVAAGGAKRNGLRPKDVLASFELPLRGHASPAASGPTPAAAGRWDGPVETWPKASDVLLEFAQPLLPGRVPAEAAKTAMTLAATIWSAVVQADAGRDPSLLEDTRRRLKGQGPVADLVELMIGRKRSLFAQDTRIMMVEKVAQRGDELNVRVQWTLA